MQTFSRDVTLICPDMIWLEKSQMVIYTPDTPNHPFQMDIFPTISHLNI